MNETAEPSPDDITEVVEASRRREGIAWLAALASLILLLLISILAVRGDLSRWLGPIAGASGDASRDAALALPEGSRNERDDSRPPRSLLPADSRNERQNGPPQSIKESDEAAAAEEATQSSSVPASVPAAEIPAATDATLALPTLTDLADRTPTVPAPHDQPPAAISSWRSESGPGMTLAQIAGSDGWTWLLPGEVLPTGSWLQSMPIDRIRIVGDDQREVTLIGATRLQIVPAAAALAARGGADLELAIDFGKVLLRRSAASDGRHALRLGGRTLSIELHDAGSSIAFERRPFRYPGQVVGLETETAGAAHDLWQMIGVTGTASVSDGVSAWTLNPSTAVVLLDSLTIGSGPIRAMPAWVDHQDELERASGESLARHLDRNLAPESAWGALLNHERPEVRMTALECLTEIGLYEPVWNALDDAGNRTNWRRRLITIIGDQLARGEGRAERLVAAAPTVEVGETSLRLWQGVSPEQLSAGEGALLVAGLEHERLVVRSLAFEQLLRITGSTELFVPEADPLRRELRVTEWRKRLAAGTIAYSGPIELPRVRFEVE